MRQTWDPREEYRYYQVDAFAIRSHMENQLAAVADGSLCGRSLARALGMDLDGVIKNRNILEIGAGEAVLSTALAQMGAGRVTALDAVPRQIWAAAAFKADSLNVRFVIGDLADMPFEDKEFDIVVANLVLHHVEPIDVVLSEIGRVLRPDGVFSALEPSTISGRLSRTKSSKNEGPLSPRRLRNAALGAGFSSATTSYYWVRRGTSLLGPLSPSYRLLAKGLNLDVGRPTKKARDLQQTEIPGLWIDSCCPFKEMAKTQMRSIVAQWRQSGSPEGFPAPPQENTQNTEEA
jgi:2-polyprenyl-3-methyl-5-hydroxy-6-metoxy-1,4-benzoquinol methylase